MKISEKKYQIFNENHQPLCWEDKILIFDNFQATADFLDNIYDTDPIDPMTTCVGLTSLFSDKEYLNATCLKPIYLEDDYNMALIDATTEQIVYI